MIKVFCAFVLMCVSFLVYSQNENKLDSLLNAYKNQTGSIEKVNTAENIFIETRQSNPELALNYLHKGLFVAKRINFSEGEAKAYKNLGHYYVNYYNLDSLRFYFKKSEHLFESINDKNSVFKILILLNRTENLEGHFKTALELSNKSIAIATQLKSGLLLSEAHQQQSTIHLDSGNYKSALEQLILAAKALDTLTNKNPLKEAIIKVGIGRTETLRNNYLAAIPYIEEGVAIFEDLNHEKWLAISYMELGNTQYHLKQYDKALLNYNKGLKISKAKKWDNFISPYLSNIGAIYLDTEEYDKALQYFFNSNKISSKQEPVNNKIIYLNDVASAYLGKKEYQKAITHYTKAIKLADSIASMDNLSDNYKERAEAYGKSGNYKNAVQDYKTHITLNDSLFNVAKAQQIEELRTIYETEKKEQEITLQKNEIDLLEQKAKVSNLQNLLLGGGLLLSLALVAFGSYGFRQKLKRHSVEKEKLDNELAFKKKELTTYALNLARKNEVLEGLKQKAQELKTQQNQDGYQHLIRTIDFDLKDDNNWENFSKYFQQVHKDFNRNVKQKFPEVTPNELRLMSLLKMNLSSKEIASILNISNEGIKKARYRIRKKLGLNAKESLENLILSI
ncbi:tetratricopeptide repeat protein [Gelatiniphilus marinus]|uniref:Tetratricopeptide repeat protein n=1 Tax=Gelatiniphilus marinus TaxID=1759464 RepID=A0ABW5JR98_9FLAO